MAKHMSEVILKISSIKNLDMVNFYHLFDEGTTLPGILAYYNNSDVINLCAADEGFPFLLEKIVEVYFREKNFGRIVLDEATKDKLDRSISCSEDSYKEIIAGLTETERPVYLNKAFVHTMMLPLVKYIIEGIQSTCDMDVTWDVYNRDWFGRGTLTGTVKEKRTNFPYRITQLSDKLYRIMINGLIRHNNTLTVDVCHDAKGISASFSDNIFGFSGTLTADITDTVPKLSFSVKKAGESVYFTENALTENTESAATGTTRFTPAEGSFKRLDLPWGERIYMATDGSREYSIFEAGAGAETIAFAIGSEKLHDVGEAPVYFGLFSYMLFDSPGMTELHFLDMGYPQSALYKENYAGKCYTLNKGGNYGN
ncbi:MAG: hypothetical protein J5626_01375 [Lachnospiraceae bacterium]|nr:hypothetical protein [Lachnospiraceae bacterium]